MKRSMALLGSIALGLVAIVRVVAQEATVPPAPQRDAAAEAQAVDRAHRIGQQRPVMVYRLVAQDTIEEKVMDLKARKERLVSAVLGDDALGAGDLAAEDIRELLDLPPDPPTRHKDSTFGGVSPQK